MRWQLTAAESIWKVDQIYKKDYTFICFFLSHISIYKTHHRSSSKKLSTASHLLQQHDACGLLEDKRMSSFMLQDNVSFISQGLSQWLFPGKCSLNISQNKIVNKHIGRYALLWVNLTFVWYTLIIAHSHLCRIPSTAENWVYL